MTFSVLQKISQQTLPCVLTGVDVEAVEVLVLGGLVRATISPDEAQPDGVLAVVHAITPMGHRHLDIFRKGY